jgi:hypothetical protein
MGDKKRIRELTEKLERFEVKFNIEEVSRVEVTYLKEDKDYYYADVVVVFKGGDMDLVEECKYPKKLIDIFEED